MNNATIDLVKHFESLHDGDLKKIGLQPKRCPADIWTEGYGRAMIDPATKKHLRGANNEAKAIQLQTIRTEEEACAALGYDLGKYAQYAQIAIGALIWEKLNENQRGALTSFMYNCGQGKPPYKVWKNTELFIYGKLNKSQLTEYWKTSVIKGGGVVLKGLVKRREAEAKLFFTV